MMRPRFHPGLRTWLIALVIGVVVPFAVFAGWRAREQMKTLDAQQRARAMDLATRIAARAGDHVAETRRMLAAVSALVVPERARSAENNRLLETVGDRLAINPASLFLVDTAGLVIAAQDSDARGGISVADRDWFRDLMTTRAPVVSQPIELRPLPGPWGVTIAVPIRDRLGRILGAMAAAERIAALDPLVDIHQALPEGSIASLFDHGVVLSRSSEARRYVGQDLSQYPAVAAMLRTPSGTDDYIWVDGVRRLSAFTAVPGTRWQVVIGIPVDSVLAPAQRELRRELGLSFLTLLCALIVAWLIGRRIVGPIRVVTIDAITLAQGGGTPLPGSVSDLTRGNEVEALSAAFHLMADRIEERTNALRDSESRARAYFAESPIPMYVFDDATKRFLDVNRAALAFYGWNREDFLALALRDLRPPDAVETLESDLAVRSDTLTLLPGRRHQTRDGRECVVDIVTSTATLGGRTIVLVAVIDQTERAQAERALSASQEQLRQSQKMEAVGRLAGGIAHDFNNILTGIIGHTDLALEEISHEDPAYEEMLAVRAAADRAAALTKQILAFGRRSVLQPIALDAGTTVTGLERMLRRLVEERIRIVTRVEAEVAHVFADPAQLEQVLLNLALNARDAMPDGGTLMLEAGPIRLGELEATTAGLAAGEFVRFAVRDTGTGMTAAVRARIFEPFFTTKGPGHGTGLGLATAYGIVQQAGGAIRVNSTPGHGSTFEVLLPRHQAGESVATARSGPARQLEIANGEVILLAEDEPVVRKLTATILTRLGYRVLVAEDGTAALTLARAHEGRIDLLLTDVVMPSMNGRELAERIVAERPGTPVLFMSGYTEDPTLKQAIADERVAFLDKPFTAAQLSARVRDVMSAPAIARA